MKIKENMTIGEVVRTYPQVVETLMGFGMMCVGCPSAQVETLAEAAMVHGIDLEEFMKKLNEAI